MLPEPTIAELVKAFHDGVRTSRDRYADGHDGSVYDHFAGVGAIQWSRQARRDTDLFRAIYVGSAEGKDLTRILNARGFERTEETYGTGTAKLRRATVAAADGTIWKGSRIVIGGSLVDSRRYVVSSDEEVGATATTATVKIRAEKPGSGTAINFPATGLFARVDDALWDSTWTVDSLTCDDGTAFEPAPAARARFRDTRRSSRAGFVDAMVAACRDAGAEHAVLLSSDYAGDDHDHGLNMAYVGDASFHGSEELVRRVAVKLERYRVLGDNLQVRPLTRQDLVVRANVFLWTTLARVNVAEVRRLLNGAIIGYFDGATDGYSYNRDALAGAMLKASTAVQYVTFDLPSSNAGVVSTVGGLINFPATLNRYRVRLEDITLNLKPPI